MTTAATISRHGPPAKLVGSTSAQTIAMARLEIALPAAARGSPRGSSRGAKRESETPSSSRSRRPSSRQTRPVSRSSLPGVSIGPDHLGKALPMTASLPPLPTSDQAQAARFLCDRGAEPAPATARRRKPRHESKHVRLDVPPSSNPIESLSGAAAAAAELKRTPRYQYFEELEANEYALYASEGAAAAAAAGTTGAAFPISGSAPIVMNDNYFGSRAREYFFETFHEFSHMRWAHGGEVKSVAPPFADGDADGSPARLPSNGHELVTGFDAREFFSKEAFSAALDREWHRRASQKAAPYREIPAHPLELGAR